jgi:ATP-dependent protease ClpP protease subunit
MPRGKRNLYCSSLEDDTVETFIKALHTLENSLKPISLFLSSTGGSVYNALQLYDAIKNSPCHITCYASGAVMSSATLVLAACDAKVGSHNATFMYHQLSDSFTDTTLSSLKVNLKECERLYGIMLSIYIASSNKEKAWWEKVLNSDSYFSSTDMIQYGLIDRIE